MSIIAGIGSSLPTNVVKNDYFLQHLFYDKNGRPLDKDNTQIIEKLESITGIKERRYIPYNESSVPLMLQASQKAIYNSLINKNALDGIIVAHNAGNMVANENHYHSIPNLAALLKNALAIKKEDFFAYDILFGCPGWLQAIIQGHQAIQCGDAKHILIVGVEVASRLLDPHDLDSMIFADGCGACVLSYEENETNTGLLSHATFSHAQDDVNAIYQGGSNNEMTPGACYAKMNGKEVYKYATTQLPKVIRKALDKSGLTLSDVDIFLFHQANGKMLHVIANNLTSMYGLEKNALDGKIPLNIEYLGNTSVATIPTLTDMVLDKKIEGFEIEAGDIAVFASVGAGMHCNAIVYRF